MFLEPGSEASRFSYILFSKLVSLGSWSSLGLLGGPWASLGCLGCLGLPAAFLWLSWRSPGALLGTRFLLGLGFLLCPGSLLGTGSLLGPVSLLSPGPWLGGPEVVGRVGGWGSLAVGRVGWLGPLVD